MISLINQFSYALVALVILVPTGYFALIARRSLVSISLLLALVAALMAINLALRYSGATLTSAKKVENLLHSGKPTLLEFYSSY